MGLIFLRDKSGIARANDVRPRWFYSALAGLLACAGLFWVMVGFRHASVHFFLLIGWVSLLMSGLRLLACFSPKPHDFGTATPCDNLPKYTVLVPLFHEAHMVAKLIAALSRLRYPRDQLEIILITEAVDPQTTAAVAKALTQPATDASFRQITVPPGTPQTKPRALNYALLRSHGAFVTIYDAEDRPHPDQLLAAIAAFRAKPDWAALQAPLNYFNSDENHLTRQFALEYAALFHVWVPFLSRLGLPFPLGGTSNYMRRKTLEQLGGWDAYNVTEDADMSFRLAACHHKIGYIHPPTFEEAVSQLSAWKLQRARWLKGYIQTWDTHMSRPLAPGGWTGIKRFVTLQITLGLSLLSALIYGPLMAGLLCVWGIRWAADIPLNIDGQTIGFLAFALGAGIFTGMVGAARAKQPRLIRFAVFMPLYWLCLFGPAVRAFRELRHKRFVWHKTQHGVSGLTPVDSTIIADPSHEPIRRPPDH